MTERELLKLKKSDMLEIMLAQSRKIDALQKEIVDLKAKIDDNEIRINESGSIAEASLRLTRVFDEAQKAADIYLENIERLTTKQAELYNQTSSGRTAAGYENTERGIGG